MSSISSILNSVKTTLTSVTPSLSQAQSTLSSGAKVVATGLATGFSALQLNRIFEVLSKAASSVGSAVLGFVPQGVQTFVGAQADKVTPLLSKVITFIRPGTYVSKLPTNLQPAGAAVAVLAEAVALATAGIFVIRKLWSSEAKNSTIDSKPSPEPSPESSPVTFDTLTAEIRTLLDQAKALADGEEKTNVVSQINKLLANDLLKNLSDPTQLELLGQLQQEAATLSQIL